MAGSTAWVTGAASGVGRHITGALLSRGWHVMASDIEQDKLEQVAQEDHWPDTQVLLNSFDIRQEPGWCRGLEILDTHWGRLDLMLNIAGYLKPGFICDTSEQSMNLHIDINVKGVILGSRLTAVYMVQQGTGHIVNLASLGGVMAAQGIGLYCASKFAVRGFSLALQQELADKGVFVTVVCPDAIATPMLDSQRGCDETVMTFATNRLLTVRDIEQALFEKILPKRPVEFLLPLRRGMSVKLLSAFPSLVGWLKPYIIKKGLRQQQKYKGCNV